MRPLVGSRGGLVGRPPQELVNRCGYIIMHAVPSFLDDRDARAGPPPHLAAGLPGSVGVPPAFLLRLNYPAGESSASPGAGSILRGAVLRGVRDPRDPL